MGCATTQWPPEDVVLRLCDCGVIFRPSHHTHACSRMDRLRGRARELGWRIRHFFGISP
jgi:hypothetical protein